MQTVDKSGFSHNPKILPKSFWEQTAKLLPQSHKSLDCGSGSNREFETRENADPLKQPRIVRIRLSEAASAALAAVGEGAFAVACQGSYPDSAGRWVILSAPIAWQAAKDASDVLLGRATAKRTKPAKLAPPDTVRHD